MEFIFSELFFTFLGWTFFLFKYRDRRKMTKAKDAEYDGSYANVGRSVAFNTFSIILGLLILSLFIAGIIGTIRFGFS